MGMFEEMLGGSLYGSATQAYQGSPFYPGGIAAMDRQQQAMYQAMQMGHLPFDIEAQLRASRNPFVPGYEQARPRKKVESRVLSPDEVAHRQITGAVQAVKEAQEGP